MELKNYDVGLSEAARGGDYDCLDVKADSWTTDPDGNLKLVRGKEVVCFLPKGSWTYVLLNEDE